MATATARRTRTLAPSGKAKTVLAKTPKVEQPTVEAKASSMEIAAHLSPGRMAIATLTPDRLRALAFVSTYNTEDPQSTSRRGHGYQREPMEERFPGIGRYYAKGDNRHRIPALIASVRLYDAKTRGRFNTLFNQGNISKIHQEFGKSVFSIVDGQHRMGGLFWAWEKLEDFNANVPVMLYYGLSYREEAELFDDINTNQRKLPKALIEATKVHTEAGSTNHDQQLREIALSLAEAGDSVWYGKVNMTGKPRSPEPMSYEGIRRSVGSMFTTRILGRLEDKDYSPDEVAKRFWELVSKACYPAWSNEPRWVENESQELVEEPVQYRLKDVVGVSAISKLGQDIINTALDKSKNVEEFWDVMAEYISKLGEVDWEKRRNNPYMATSAGFGGQGQLYEILYNLVYLGKAPGVAAAVEEK